VPGGPLEEKAAFNNFPFRYGTVERTSSEHAISGLADLLVAQYTTLPPELQAGSILDAAQAALASTPDGNYVDGDPRTFTCQTCHMPPVQGQGAKQSFAPTRDDLPLHDMTGGNYWMPSVMQYLDAQDALVLGGGLTDDELAGMDAGALRAAYNLARAAALEVEEGEDELEVYNLTGHKLLTGFPEGRRAWLRVRWRSAGGQLLREDGAYGDLDVVHEGTPMTVRTLLDPYDPHTRVYEVHYGMTQEWAAQLVDWGWPPDLTSCSTTPPSPTRASRPSACPTTRRSSAASCPFPRTSTATPARVGCTSTTTSSSCRRPPARRRRRSSCCTSRRAGSTSSSWRWRTTARTPCWVTPASSCSRPGWRPAWPSRW
jgi:hypothetical protein